MENQNSIHKASLLISLFAGLLFGVQSTQAQNFPSKPVRIIVPFAPGGDTDVVARKIGEQFQAKLGQPAIIDNRPGAGGLIGFNALTSSEADGHTIAFLISLMDSFPALFKAWPADWYTKISPITKTHSSFLVLATNPQVPAKTLAEFISYAKANPTKVNIGAPSGSLDIYMFKQMAKLEIPIITYKGAIPAQTANLANEVQMTVESIRSAKSLFESGRLVPLAIAAPQRNALMPGVPTAAETLPGFESTFFYAMVAPAGTPRSVVGKLNEAIGAIVKMPDMQKWSTEVAYIPTTSTSEELGKIYEEETRKWLQVAKGAGIEAQ